ncbi:hypothetical protein C0995_006100 [Termitomyces sp. Mi166|nr:hypothetical protein C0995_006100 [Termitomyces sp. Mi166\
MLNRIFRDFVGKRMSVQWCLAFCSQNGYSYAGVEYGRECYCDYSVRPSGALADDTTCNMPCTGNRNEMCGGASRINIYWNEQQVGPANPASIGGGAFTYDGCYTDNVNNTRSLPVRFDIAGDNYP